MREREREKERERQRGREIERERDRDRDREQIEIMKVCEIERGSESTFHVNYTIKPFHDYK